MGQVCASYRFLPYVENTHKYRPDPIWERSEESTRAFAEILLVADSSLRLGMAHNFASMAADEGRLYKIGEVCKIADVQPYVLRYWETEFPALAPNKSGGGQRLYSQREIDTILRIKQLLYSEGFTIAGAKKKLETETSGGEVPVPHATASTPAQKDLTRALLDVRKELRAILQILSREDSEGSP